MGQIKGLKLKAADRPELERWARARNLPYRQVQRARMLRALAEGQAVAVVATVVVGHPDPTPSHAYIQAVAGPRV